MAITLEKLIMVITNLDSTLADAQFEVQGNDDELVIRTGLKSGSDDVSEMIPITSNLNYPSKPVEQECKEEEDEA